ncbi:hydrogenase expression/formation protein [Marinobacterium arenosum]|uniref:hydrogenase expression/formation protein n=1 Tax=Marinobacterium arenosum TaxID=2862496 RepID=UPI001C947D20|nr:hydrogenase expression/formation protein [Marinobacterium arenosum]MBY4677396.1 hydrogenase expression/formation protein [Marinobacterium arenosum]
MPSDIPLINIPLGPGSRPESDDERVLDYLPMPSEMASYDMPVLPEAEQAAQCPQAVALLDKLQHLLDGYRVGLGALSLPMGQLPLEDQDLLNQILGEGEVSLVFEGEPRILAQETVLAGVWRLRTLSDDGDSQNETIEVADIPARVRSAAFHGCQPLTLCGQELAGDLLNAPAVLTELAEHTQNYRPGRPPHVVNLSLLPFSPNDHQFLDEKLGAGPVTILSRGYGNCRITSTRVPALWRVQYYNSTDQLILDTLEVVDVPAVACAAQEDIDDSALRLREIREVLV